jgi:inorganic pyrophosphatase
MTAGRTQLCTCCILHVLEFLIKLHETYKSKRLVVVDQHGQQSAQLYLPNYNFMPQYLPLNVDAYSVCIIKSQFISMFANQGPYLKTLANNLYLHTLTL